MSDGSAQSSPLSEAILAGAIAVLATGGAVWIGWMLGWPWIFDVNDPDFNPMLLVVGILTAVAVWHAVSALRWYFRHRSFGTTVLILDGAGHVQLGRLLSGVVRSERPVAATGPYRLVLACLDVHETGGSGESGRREAYPVWTAERSLPQDSDAQKGLRFSFDLPTSVGPDPVPSGILSDGKLFRYRMTVNLPGFRKVFQKDSPPVDRYWTLTITAPTAGADFRSELQIPLHSG